MRITLIAKGLILVLSSVVNPSVSAQSGDGYQDLSIHVYRITSSDCGRNHFKHVLSGAKIIVDDTPGIITALHGVAGCKSISARNAQGSIGNLVIKLVDVPNDVAFLTAEKKKRTKEFPAFYSLEDSLPLSSDDMEPIKVIGYPLGLNYQVSLLQEFHENKLVKLTRLIPPRIYETLEERASPSVNTVVYSLSGTLTRGYSGAPILNEQNEIIAIALGGLAEGLPDINWALPTRYIFWKPVKDNKAKINSLAKNVASELFGIKIPSTVACIGDFKPILGRDVYNNNTPHKFDLSEQDNIRIEIVKMSKRRKSPIDVSLWGGGFEFKGSLSKGEYMTSFITEAGNQYKFKMIHAAIDGKDHARSSIRFEIEGRTCLTE